VKFPVIVASKSPSSNRSTVAMTSSMWSSPGSLIVTGVSTAWPSAEATDLPAPATSPVCVSAEASSDSFCSNRGSLAVSLAERTTISSSNVACCGNRSA
jgi:hypothetical protein